MTVHFLYQFGLTISDLHKSQAHIVEPTVKSKCKALCSNEQSQYDVPYPSYDG